uniref:C-type lectin domain-containing protein n=1 Tax=Sphenodon punctatus TaxID=8508 RepID=A0A8D0GWZ1_SPHPU
MLLLLLLCASLIPVISQSPTSSSYPGQVVKKMESNACTLVVCRPAERVLPGRDGRDGIVGPQGKKGDQGLQGAIGLQGPQGITGPSGPKGDRGPTGEKGAKGDTGDRGEWSELVWNAPFKSSDFFFSYLTIGLQGLTGLQGPKGQIGSPGSQGDKGSIGDKGTKGDSGLSGNQQNNLELSPYFLALTFPNGKIVGDKIFMTSGYEGNFDDLKKKCMQAGGQLASPRNNEENAAVQQIVFTHDKSVFLGINDIQTEGKFTYLDGKPIVYSNWQPGEPNNDKGIEDCVQVFSTGKWNDKSCDERLLILCEF